eukprot:9891963-Lingulodinium_polyedra.AAC.1
MTLRNRMNGITSSSSNPPATMAFSDWCTRVERSAGRSTTRELKALQMLTRLESANPCKYSLTLPKLF